MGKIDDKSHPKKSGEKKKRTAPGSRGGTGAAGARRTGRSGAGGGAGRGGIAGGARHLKKKHQLTSSDLFDGKKHGKNWEVGDVVWRILRQNLRIVHQDLDPKQGG